MNVSHAKFQKKFDSGTISRELPEFSLREMSTCTCSFARTNDVNIVRRRDAECNNFLQIVRGQPLNFLVGKIFFSSNLVGRIFFPSQMLCRIFFFSPHFSAGFFFLKKSVVFTFRECNYIYIVVIAVIVLIWSCKKRMTFSLYGMSIERILIY